MAAMSDSCVSNRLHIVFGTKYRLRALSPSVRERLFPYIVALGKEFDIEVLEIGGMEDHLHLLIALPASISLAEAVKRLKAKSSRRIRQEFGIQKFAWQTGYGAFSVGLNAYWATRQYIAGQIEHHKRHDFREEMEQMFRQHGVDPKSIPWFTEAV